MTCGIYCRMSVETPSRLNISTRERRLVLRFAALTIAVYLLAVAVGWVESGTPSVAHAVLEPALYPVLYFYAPPVLAAYNDFRGGSLPGSLLLGAVPGLTFPILAGLAMAVRTGPADSPAWVMTLAFLAIGLAGAGAGIVFSRMLQWLLKHADVI